MEMEAPRRAPMVLDTGKKAQELKLNQPKAFDGKRNELDDFVQDIQLYLAINDDVYDSDKKRIAYTLSFMSEGDAKSWKGQFLRNATTPTGVDLGTWAQFLTDLKAAFQPYDAPGDALEELTTLKMGNTSIEDHIAKYKILLVKSGVSDTSPSAIDYFRRTLNVPLQRKIMELPTPPTNLKEWYEWANRLDNNFRKMQRIFGRGQTTTNNGKGKEEPRRRWNFQRKDPNAMDVDTITTTMNAMTVEEREKFMKEGLCFRCRKTGHISRDCPLKKGNVQILPRPTTSTPIPPKKMKGAELVAHIRSLTTGLDKEEMKEFMDLAEETGF
jgi:Ty3 transposon capsid-like protein/Zinc knuckle